MTRFDPEKFEDKYQYYFDELEEAYSNAFQQLHGECNSELLRTIDRQVLAVSEPVYEDGSFRVELPEDPIHELELNVDEAEFERVLDQFVIAIESELERIFDP